MELTFANGLSAAVVAALASGVPATLVHKADVAAAQLKTADG
jgi:hypothetical protein